MTRHECLRSYMVEAMYPDAASEPAGWPLLAQIAYTRRKRLGISRQQMSDHNGPAANTVRHIENQTPDAEVATRSLYKLDRALSWPQGTAECLIYANIPEAVADWATFISISINDVDDRPDETIPARINRNKISSMSEEISQVNSYLLFADYHLAGIKEAASDDQARDIHALEESIHDARSIVFGWIRAARKDA